MSERESRLAFQLEEGRIATTSDLLREEWALVGSLVLEEIVQHKDHRMADGLRGNDLDHPLMLAVPEPFLVSELDLLMALSVLRE